MAELDNHVALVTGAASGIGRATANRLAQEGAHVIVADLDQVNGMRVAEEVKGEFLRLDVGDPDNWSEVMDTLRHRWGGLDIAHLNAGVTLLGPGFTRGEEETFDIASLSEDDYRRIMGANVDGVVYGARAVAPVLEARGGGAVVVTASAAGLIAFPADPIYTLTKHAVVGLVRALAPGLAERKIRINAICPALVDTNLIGQGGIGRMREVGVDVMDPEQIAEAVLGAITSGATGRLYVCLAGRDPHEYEHAPIEGLELDPDAPL